jgi:UDP-glucose 4-epimerase
MNDKTILVTGGAGYIGGFMVRKLVERGYTVVAIDNLSRNDRPELPESVNFVEGSVGDRQILKSIFENTRIDGVIHFAAFISMAESMKDPFIYFEDNVYDTLILLEEMKNHNVKNIIFSSTAGVYGNPTILPIPEDHPKNPTNPYGQSKLMVEQILAWYQKIYGLSYTALRYFNACGASLDGKHGENHKPETHIIPRAITALIHNEPFELFGRDYQTPDGTCVRDYIHVLDLVEAHVLALEKLFENPTGSIYNVGTGQGLSNSQILKTIEEVTGRQMDIVEKERRPGDANELVADVTKIKNELGFAPQYSDIKTIVESAWKFHNKQ